jgi:hypothetical protein
MAKQANWCSIQRVLHNTLEDDDYDDGDNDYDDDLS